MDHPSTQVPAEQEQIPLRPLPSISRISSRPRSVSVDSQTVAAQLSIPVITTTPSGKHPSDQYPSSSSSSSSTPPVLMSSASSSVLPTSSSSSSSHEGNRRSSLASDSLSSSHHRGSNEEAEGTRRSSGLFSSLRSFGSKHRRTSSMGKDPRSTIHNSHDESSSNDQKDEEGKTRKLPSNRGVSSTMYRPSKSSRTPGGSRRKSSGTSGHSLTLSESSSERNSARSQRPMNSHRIALQQSINSWVNCISNLPLNLFPSLWKDSPILVTDIVQSVSLRSSLISSSSSSLSLSSSSSSSSSSLKPGSPLILSIEHQIRKNQGSTAIIKPRLPSPPSSPLRSKTPRNPSVVEGLIASSPRNEEDSKKKEEIIEDPIDQMTRLMQILFDALEEHFSVHENSLSSSSLRFRFDLSQVDKNPLQLIRPDSPIFLSLSRFITEFVFLFDLSILSFFLSFFLFFRSLVVDKSETNKRVDLSKCKLNGMLDLSAFPKLKRATIKNNKLTGLSLNGLGSLEFLDLSSNLFSSLPNFTYQSTSLKFLDIHTNQQLTGSLS